MADGDIFYKNIDKDNQVRQEEMQFTDGKLDEEFVSTSPNAEPYDSSCVNDNNEVFGKLSMASSLTIEGVAATLDKT